LVDILTYHVLPEQVLSKDLAPFQAVDTVEGKKLHVQKWGGGVRVGPSLLSKDLKNVIAADNLASNGVAHIIDGVLLPPTAPTPPAPKAKNIVELAEGVPALSTFVAAVVGGDLAGWLSSPGPDKVHGETWRGGMVTVFAPTNDAFTALPKGVLDSLMKPENKAQLVDLLTYHVVGGAYYLKDFQGSLSDIQSVEGKLVQTNGIKINDANIVTPDVMASNGVVHVVDGVLKCWPCPPWQEPHWVDDVLKCVPKDMASAVGHVLV